MAASSLVHRRSPRAGFPASTWVTDHSQPVHDSTVLSEHRLRMRPVAFGTNWCSDLRASLKCEQDIHVRERHIDVHSMQW